MECPKCKSIKTFVVESRKAGTIRRKRKECRDCSHRFTTHEMYQEEYNSLIEKVHKLRRLEQVLRPLLDINQTLDDTNIKSSASICPCNDCEYASAFGCSFGYPEYGTMDAVDCVMHEVSK